MDERAFLDTLQAQPDDDTTRLVYADWLDEHDQPERAEYLRADVVLAKTGERDRESSPAGNRVGELGYALDTDWIESVGRRYDVVLQRRPPERMLARIGSPAFPHWWVHSPSVTWSGTLVDTIQTALIRGTGSGRTEAEIQRLLASPPSVLAAGLTWVWAFAVKHRLCEWNAGCAGLVTLRLARASG